MTETTDYCGCCGGPGSDAPKGEHDDCCASLHDPQSQWEVTIPFTTEDSAVSLLNRISETTGFIGFVTEVRLDPLARYDGTAGDLVPGYGESADGLADARDQRKADR